jgi:hypothetical protein
MLQKLPGDEKATVPAAVPPAAPPAAGQAATGAAAPGPRTNVPAPGQSKPG